MESKSSLPSPFALSDSDATQLALELEYAIQEEREKYLNAEQQRRSEKLLAEHINQQKLKRLCAPRLTGLSFQGSREEAIEVLKRFYTKYCSWRISDKGVFTLVVCADEEESRDLRAVLDDTRYDLGLGELLDDYEFLPLARLKLATIVALNGGREEYFSAQRLWKSAPTSGLPHVRWCPLNATDEGINPLWKRFLWPELDSLDEQLPTHRWWQIEISANVAELSKLDLSSFGVEKASLLRALLDSPEFVAKLFKALLVVFLSGRGLLEANPIRESGVLEMARTGVPSWLRLAHDEVMACRFREMAVAAGVWSSVSTFAKEKARNLERPAKVMKIA